MVTDASLQARLDIFEKVLLLIFYGLFSFRMVHAYLQDGVGANLIVLFDQLIILFFTLIRKKAQIISQSYRDWGIAILGTLLPLLVAPIGSTWLVPPHITVPIMMLGLSLHLVAKFYLSRSFGVVPAKREIKRLGPYRIVRHPMYLGYMIVQTGLFLSGPTLYNFCVILSCWTFHILRISAEEKILKQDPQYHTLVAQTPYRLLPWIY